MSQGNPELCKSPSIADGGEHLGSTKGATIVRVVVVVVVVLRMVEVLVAGAVAVTVAAVEVVMVVTVAVAVVPTVAVVMVVTVAVAEVAMGVPVVDVTPILLSIAVLSVVDVKFKVFVDPASLLFPVGELFVPDMLQRLEGVVVLVSPPQIA